MNFQSTAASSYDDQQPLPNKSQKRRGKINIVACDKCKHDKKRCDGNYLTQKACKYCRKHGEVCIYSEPNLLRISRILNAAAKNAAAAEEREDEKIKQQIAKYENTISSLANQLENKKESDIIGQLYLSLFSNPQISDEQTIILKKLCVITNNVNSSINGEILGNIRNNLLILSSNDSMEVEKRHSWKEIEDFINDSSLTTTNFFGFSYPSGSTTPIPSPQFNDFHFTSNHGTNYKTSNSKKFEPYPSVGRIITKSCHQSDLYENIPIIAVHEPHSIDSNVTATFQNSNIQFDDFSSNENLQFSTLLSSHKFYGFDDVGLDEADQPSPTISNNSISDDNMDIFMPDSSINWLELYSNLTTFQDNI